MEINSQVEDILKEYRINRSAGLLVLLGIYHNLDVDTVCPEEAIKAINLTKIVEKDYTTNIVKWNIPLFEGQEVAFDWVKDWIDGFGKVNPDRKGELSTSIKRMKEFFSKNPEYRKEDVYAARDFYFGTLASNKYCMKSHKFIYDGAGVMKNSTLLEFCQKVKAATSNSNLKGTIIS